MAVISLATFLSAVLSAIIGGLKKNRNLISNILRMILVYSPILLVTVFRLNTNVDDDTTYLYGSYYKFFHSVILGEDGKPFDLLNEPLSWGIIELFAKCNVPYFTMLACFGVIYVLSFSVFIEKTSVNKVLSIVIFLLSGMFTFSFAALRQSMAMSFILWAYALVCKKRKMYFKDWLKVTFVLLFGGLFHFTCVLILPVIIISKLKIKINVFLLLSVITVLMTPVIGLMLKALLSATRFGARLASEELDFAYSYVVLGSVLSIIMFMQYKVWNKRDANADFFIKMTLLFTVIMCLSSYLIDPFRIFFLFCPIFMLAIPSLLKSYDKTNAIIAGIIILGMFAVLFLRLNYNYRYESVLPIIQTAIKWR